MKNIDKIRNMSAEELARKVLQQNGCIFCSYNDGNCGTKDCTVGQVVWLNQEVNPMPELKAGDIVINHSDAQFVVRVPLYGCAKDMSTETIVKMENIKSNGYAKKVYRYNKEKGDMEEIWRADNDL